MPLSGTHTTRRGSAIGNSKLTDDCVRGIRKLARQGHTADDLAHRYGVSVSNVRTILQGKTWKHVTDEEEAL
jgi:uncharacterized protein YjcR